MIVQGKGRGWEFVSFPNLPQPLDLLLHIVYLILASLCVHLIIKNKQPTLCPYQIESRQVLSTVSICISTCYKC